MIKYKRFLYLAIIVAVALLPLASMVAQAPALFETLSGMPISELFAKVRTIGEKSPRDDDKAKGAGAS